MVRMQQIYVPENIDQQPNKCSAIRGFMVLMQQNYVSKSSHMYQYNELKGRQNTQNVRYIYISHKCPKKIGTRNAVDTAC